MGAYLRKMAIDGIIVNTDTTYLEKQFYEMHKIGVNVNQLARLANSTGAVTPEEMKEEVRRVRRILGPSIVISPSHEEVLPNIPPANLVAMAQASKE